jgi:acyl-coenzyme A thioesterase PaaI-like protein
VSDGPDTRDVADLRADAGRAVRDLGHALIGRDVPPELLAETADVLSDLVARYDGAAPRSRDLARFGNPLDNPPPSGSRLTSYDDRPVSGRSSPWGMDIEVHRHGDEVEALVTLRAAHEGAPGRSHGGIVAALFDDVFGFVLGVLQEAAFTGELNVRFLAPTPLYRRLACRARLASHEGRKLFIEGELVDVEDLGHPVVVARGRATFVTVDREVFRQASAERPAPADEDTGGA